MDYLEELKNIDKVEFKVILEKESTENLDEYLLNNDIYNYAILNDDLKTEIALPKGDLILIERKIDKEIKIKDKVYYTSYKISKQKQKEIIRIGKGIFFDLNNNKINFNFQGMLQERITDMTFFVDLITSKTLTINGVILNFPEYKKNKDETKEVVVEFNKKIEELKELSDKFIEMNTTFKEDIDKLEQQDRNNLLLFKKIFCDKIIPKDLKIEKFGLNFIKIGNCYIAILVQKDKEGKIKISNFFEKLDDIITIVIAKDNEKPNIKNRTSPYFMLKSENILKFSNFNSDIVFKSLKLIENWKKQSDYINKFMLELLKAYDKNSKRKDILELAEKINNELIKREKSITNELNKFQIIKRIRDLNAKEKDIILQLRNDITKDNNFNINQCGIAILLENKYDFEYYYDKLDLEEKKEFDTFPISNLFPKNIK